MRTIVNQLFELGGFDAEKLTKFNRCLFQATLPRNHEHAMHLLVETKDMAKELAQV